MTDHSVNIMPDSDISELRLFLSIDNLDHLTASYGDGAAAAAFAMVDRILLESGHRIAVIGRKAEGYAIVCFEAPQSLHILQRRLAFTPVRLGEAVFHLAATLTKVPSPGAPFDDVSPIPAPFSGGPPPRGEDQARRYRDDMAKVTSLFRAITTNQTALAWQPVVHSRDGSILYRECLTRILDDRQDSFPIADMLLAIERLGLMRAVDSYIMLRVLDELDAAEDAVLGVNISAQSAIFDSWWMPVAERLRATPSLAARLVIEVTETAPFPSIAQAISFVAELHALGCRIALDDFGVGYASIRQLLALRPDIVKIDQSFITRTGSSKHDRDVFRRITGLAATLAPVVIAEGIETESHRKFAEQAGVMWQQGYHWGRPSAVRSWRYGSQADRRPDLP
jgi:EAL domain-containing protein (putative c-di-GMP-specific phosphodiesterase class I)